MRKIYVLSAVLSVTIITILITVLFVSAAPETPFEYIEGDDDDADLVSSVVLGDGYDGDYSEFGIITQSQAENNALAYTTGGSVVESELEEENGYLFWEVEVKYEGNEFEILMDPVSGEVLGAFYEDEGFEWFDD